MLGFATALALLATSACGAAQSAVAKLPPAASSTPTSTPTPELPTSTPFLGALVECNAADFTTTVTTNSATYGHGQTVNITAAITNASTRNCHTDIGWTVDIRYPDGHVVRIFAVHGEPAPGANFPPGTTRVDSDSWNDGSSSPGHYAVLWTWNAGTQGQPAAQKGFAIVGP
jgi:hypothetical protein